MTSSEVTEPDLPLFPDRTYMLNEISKLLPFGGSISVNILSVFLGDDCVLLKFITG